MNIKNKKIYNIIYKLFESELIIIILKATDNNKNP